MTSFVILMPREIAALNDFCFVLCFQHSMKESFFHRSHNHKHVDLSHEIKCVRHKIILQKDYDYILHNLCKG